MNNLTSVVIDKTFDEVIYNFISIQVLDLSKFSTSSKLFAKIFRIHLQIINFIAFAQIKVKYHYIKKHYLLFLKVGNYVLLRLYHEYKILFIKQFNFKLSSQYVDLFKITEKIKRLIYKLELFYH